MPEDITPTGDEPTIDEPTIDELIEQAEANQIALAAISETVARCIENADVILELLTELRDRLEAKGLLRPKAATDA